MARKYDALWAPKPRPLLIHSEIRLGDIVMQIQLGCRNPTTNASVTYHQSRNPSLPFFLRLKPLNLSLASSMWTDANWWELGRRLELKKCKGLSNLGWLPVLVKLLEHIMTSPVNFGPLILPCSQKVFLCLFDANVEETFVSIINWRGHCTQKWREWQSWYGTGKDHGHIELPCKNGAQTERLRTWTTSHEAIEHIASGSHEKVDGEITASCTSRERIFCDYHVQKKWAWWASVELHVLHWTLMNCSKLLSRTRKSGWPRCRAWKGGSACCLFGANHCTGNISEADGLCDLSLLFDETQATNAEKVVGGKFFQATSGLEKKRLVSSVKKCFYYALCFTTWQFSDSSFGKYIHLVFTSFSIWLIT